jgi:hypothetical protein
MEWTSIKDEEPSEHSHVLVSRDHFDDPSRDYFVASYNDVEKEWHLFTCIPGPEKSSYVNIQIPMKASDRWTYFEEKDV